MKKLPLSRVRIGSTLAEDVGKGQVLLGRGTEITRDHLELLRRHGVQIVTVVTKQEEPVDEEPVRKPSPEELRQLVLVQHRRFGDTRGHPVMAELFRCIINRAARGETS